MKDGHIMLVILLCDNEAHIVTISSTVNHIVNVVRVCIVRPDNYIHVSLPVINIFI